MNRQNIFLIIFVLLLAALGYFWYRYSGSAAPAATGKEDMQGTRLSELRRLKDLKLDTSLFQDKFFRNLEPSSGRLESPSPTSGVKPGRINPFVPF